MIRKQKKRRLCVKLKLKLCLHSLKIQKKTKSRTRQLATRDNPTQICGVGMVFDLSSKFNRDVKEQELWVWAITCSCGCLGIRMCWPLNGYWVMLCWIVELCIDENVINTKVVSCRFTDPAMQSNGASTIYVCTYIQEQVSLLRVMFIQHNYH